MGFLSVTVVLKEVQTSYMIIPQIFDMIYWDIVMDCCLNVYEIKNGVCTHFGGKSPAH